MFYFLCKAIFNGGRTLASPVHKLHCVQKYTSIIPLRYTSSVANKYSFTVSYLINSCGLSSKSALSASKYLNFETPEKPDLVLVVLKNHGFSKTQITELVTRLPRVLSCRPEKTLLPRLEFLNSKGISNADIVQILSICPSLFHRSLENHIIPTFNKLCQFFQSSDRAVVIIIYYPLILFHDVEHYLVPNAKILRDNGVPESNIVKFFCTWPRIGLWYTESFEKNVAAVKEMSIDPVKSQFLIAIKAKCGMNKSLWEKKVDVYKKWGWSDKEFLAAFAKHPWCMIASMNKIMAAMDFYVNEMGWESSVIAKHANLIALSLEKRIIPRAAVIKYLLSKGLVKNDTTYFSSLLAYPEKNFVEKFMNSYDEAPHLLKLYNEKLDLASKSKSSVRVEKMQ